MNKEEKIAEIIIWGLNDYCNKNFSERVDATKQITKKITSLFPDEFMLEIKCPECRGTGVDAWGSCKKCNRTGKILKSLSEAVGQTGKVVEVKNDTSKD